MKKLFIIGNGFDIQHKIPSRYQDFHDFLKKQYPFHKDPLYIPGGGMVPKIFSYGMQSQDIFQAIAYLDYTLTLTEKSDEWWNLESSLSRLHLVEEFDLESDDPFTKVQYNDSPENTIFYIGQCFRLLYFMFDIWVNQIDISNITPNESFKNLINSELDYFFTFNYTKTLENIYNAKNVFHIHGVQGNGKKEFGHQKHDEEYIVKFCEDNLIPLSCLEGVKYLFEITEKDTRKIWENNKYYFDSLDNDILQIYSYGFSFSLVDMIYIFAICHSLDTSKVTWYLSDFSSDEQNEIYKKRIRINGFQGNFSTFHISDNEINIENKINNNQKNNKEQIRKIWNKRKNEIKSKILKTLHFS